MYLSFDCNAETVSLSGGWCGSHRSGGKDNAALCVRHLDPLRVRLIQRTDWDQSHLKSIGILYEESTIDVDILPVFDGRQGR